MKTRCRVLALISLSSDSMTRPRIVDPGAILATGLGTVQECARVGCAPGSDQCNDVIEPASWSSSRPRVASRRSKTASSTVCPATRRYSPLARTLEQGKRSDDL